MPIFERVPDCFPPVIEPVGWLGDVPAFASAEGDAVVAWTPPTGFRFRVADWMTRFDSADGREFLEIHMMWRESSEKGSARDRIEHDALLDYHYVQGLVLRSTPASRLVAVALHDDVRWVAPDEMHANWWGTFSADGTTDAVAKQHVVVLPFEDSERAVAIKVNVRDANLPARHREMQEIRDELPMVIATRAGAVPAGQIGYWVVDTGFAVWDVRRPHLDPEPWVGYRNECPDPEVDNYASHEIKVVVLPVRRRSEIDQAAEEKHLLRLLDNCTGAIDIRHQCVPAHGHHLVYSFEARRATVLPEQRSDDTDDDDDDDDDQSSRGTSVDWGETLRCAYIAVGRDHVVQVRVSIGAQVEHRLEVVWQEALDRLFVSAGPCVVEPA